MGITNKLIPLLEIDLGTKKLFYSSQAMKIKENEQIIQYDGKLRSEGGVTKSFSIYDFKASVSVASNVSMVNSDRIQDHINLHPESFTGITLKYLRGGPLEDMTCKFLEINGIASSPKWDKLNFNMSIKDSQKLYFKSVPPVIFDENTFQSSFILTDATYYTSLQPIGDNSIVGSGTAATAGSKSVTLVNSIGSGTLNGRPKNFWKGSRLDVIMDTRPSDHTNNASGQFAVVVKSEGPLIYFNSVLEKYLIRADETALSIINNTLTTDDFTYNLNGSITMRLIKNPVPQNAESVGSPVPIIYGAPERVPMIWAIGQKSTRTNSFGVGDDVYLFACHPCKLGEIPDPTIMNGVNVVGADNNVWNYKDSYGTGYTAYGLATAASGTEDLFEIMDALRTEVYWSLEDKRVVDAKIAPLNKNWIPNPFPKRFRGGLNRSNQYLDHRVRLVSPLHKVVKLTSLKGEIIQGVKLRGGEFDWYDLTTPLEQRAQYPIRYGLGNSKLYISVEGWQDTIDGFYTGFGPKEDLAQGTLGTVITTMDKIEDSKNTSLIKNPADIILHFLMNYTSVNLNKNIIDIESFRKSRMLLNNWRFDTALTEIENGQDIIDRWCKQCCSIVFVEANRFKMKTIIPSKIKNNPKLYLREDEHIVKQEMEYNKTEEVYNDFIFKYFYDYPTNKFNRVIIKNKLTDSVCRESYAKNGFERSKGVIEFRDVIDDYTANQLADIYVDMHSKRRIFLNCEIAYVDEILDNPLEIGDCVSVTSSLAPGGWVEQKCIVLETRYSYSKLDLKLMEI